MSRCQPLARVGNMRRVAGIEPGTCFVLGRKAEERSRHVAHLDPGKRYATALEIEYLHAQAAITKVVES